MDNQLKLTIWDVQHGNALHISTPNGKHIVIDLGIGDYSGKNQQFSPLDELWRRGIRTLDYVLITHPHLDHIDDILKFDAFNPSTLHTPRHLSDQEVMNGVSASDRPKFEKYIALRNRYSSPVSPSNVITTPENFGGVKFSYFSTPELPTDNFNNHSVFTVMEYAGTKVVLPGDNECASITALMKQPGFNEVVRNASLLLAPHHGRKSSFHNDFVSLVNPFITVVSDGRFCDTSANPQYGAKSRGGHVWSKSRASSEQRFCLTTNSDGEVEVTIQSDGSWWVQIP